MPAWSPLVRTARPTFGPRRPPGRGLQLRAEGKQGALIRRSAGKLHCQRQAIGARKQGQRDRGMPGGVEERGEGREIA